MQVWPCGWSVALNRYNRDYRVMERNRLWSEKYLTLTCFHSEERHHNILPRRDCFVSCNDDVRWGTSRKTDCSHLVLKPIFFPVTLISEAFAHEWARPPPTWNRWFMCSVKCQIQSRLHLKLCFFRLMSGEMCVVFFFSTRDESWKVGKKRLKSKGRGFVSHFQASPP